MKKVMLTGVRPSGNLTIGNYLGAIKNFVDRQDEYDSYIFIADLHALNAVHDAKVVKQHSYEAAAFMIAMGVNLENTALFRQSDINEIYQLTEFLMNVTPKGLMNRAHSYKAMVEKILRQISILILGLIWGCILTLF